MGAAVVGLARHGRGVDDVRAGGGAGADVYYHGERGRAACREGRGRAADGARAADWRVREREGWPAGLGFRNEGRIFFYNDAAPTVMYTLTPVDAMPISVGQVVPRGHRAGRTRHGDA